MPEQLLTIPQAAKYLSISRTTMYRLINDGAIKAVLVGDRKRIPESEITDLIAEQLDHVIRPRPSIDDIIEDAAASEETK